MAYNIARDVEVFTYDGAGGFNGVAASPLGPSASSFDAGDVNGDGIVDIVIGSAQGIVGGRIVIGIGDGAGAYANIGDTGVCIASNGLNSVVKSVTLVDLDNDDDLDAAFNCSQN